MHPKGANLLQDLGPMSAGLPLLMDRAYEGNETPQLVLDLGMIAGRISPQPVYGNLVSSFVSMTAIFRNNCRYVLTYT